jgi:6-phosphofructokinase 1
MNAAIRSATRSITANGGVALGIHNGFAGLIKGDIVTLSPRDVGGILEFGGTILGSARCIEFKTEEGLQQAAHVLEQSAIDGVIVIGGNGSQTGANSLSKIGVPVIGVASTIDNDLFGTDITIGFDTALNITIEAIDRLRVTASSHRRVFVIQTMGNQSGYLALYAGLAGGAEIIVTPELDCEPEVVVEKVKEARLKGKKHVLIVVSEWAHHHADTLHNFLTQENDLSYDPRLTVLGHVVRGGAPTASDRILATRLANYAGEAIVAGESGKLIGLINGQVTATPLADIVGKTKPLPEDMVALAQRMTI